METRSILLDLRTEADLTQTELARRMGWTQGFVSQLETGRRSIAPHVLALADEFSCEMRKLAYTVEDLLRGREIRGRRRAP